MMFSNQAIFVSIAISSAASFASAVRFSGYVEVINKAPKWGTSQTPVWVGIHDGLFDTYDRFEPLPNAMDALVEDGNNAPITEVFSKTPGAVWDGTVGSAPIGPGESVYLPFEIDIEPGSPLFFSYASMILPSNDAFVSNGDSRANPIFDDKGNFIPVSVNSMGSMALDGGSEVNDEIPSNTAFFGQATPNTGVTENGIVLEHPGFFPKGSGGILDDPQFKNADFTVPGYQFMQINVVLGEPPKKEPICKVEFVLYNADNDTPVGLIDSDFCVEDLDFSKFNVQARPTEGCSKINSAMMDIDGAINIHPRIENAEPYMIFGDSNTGDIFGQPIRRGSYTVMADLYSDRKASGNLVVSGEVDFTIYDCSARRQLRRGRLV